MNAKTRERIAELAKSLNYSVNVGAQNLRLRQNKTVAVIVPYDPETRQSLTDPFFLALIGSIADALTARGLEMLLSRVNADHLDFASQAYDTGRAMGVILIGQPPLTTVRQPIQEAGAALVESLLKISEGERPQSIDLLTQIVERGTTLNSTQKSARKVSRSRD